MMQEETLSLPPAPPPPPDAFGARASTTRSSLSSADLESNAGLDQYNRLQSPGMDDAKKNIELDDDGFISGEQGLPMMSLLLGAVRMPKTSSKIITLQERSARKLDAWEFPGWGQTYYTVMDSSKLNADRHHTKHQLDLFRSTAIAGNDLLASVLYTTGICACACGQLTPFAMILTALALYPFRKIFQECGTAIPLNGGVYVAMLNSSSKLTATFAASCSLISYSATAVVSAASCTSYAAYEFGAFPEIPVTIAIMLSFAVLVLLGVKDSANVAAAIFVFHLITLFILVTCSFVSMGQDGGAVLAANWRAPLPISRTGGIGMDLYLGYSVSLLGLTGFETSANYIEEAGPFETERNKAGPTRKVSVFEKTIDRMWLLVAVINVAVAVATLGVVDLPTIQSNATVILSVVGERSSVGGAWLRRLVAVDAILVLAGGVLTAFVGVSGLIRQLASDRCLPSILLQTNRYTGTHHWIILGFFFLCTTLYLITEGNVIVLSGVFSIAFLMVLLSFAVANMKLKFCRPRLPRGASIGWPGALVGFCAMFIGLVGNVYYNPTLINFFFIYLGFYFSTIVVTFKRMQITKLALYFVNQVPFLEQRFAETLTNMLLQMKKHTVVFFAKNSELHILNKAIIYARENELCDRVIICHVSRPKRGQQGAMPRNESHASIASDTSDRLQSPRARDTGLDAARAPMSAARHGVASGAFGLLKTPELSRRGTHGMSGGDMSVEMTSTGRRRAMSTGRSQHTRVRVVDASAGEDLAAVLGLPPLPQPLQSPSLIATAQAMGIGIVGGGDGAGGGGMGGMGGGGGNARGSEATLLWRRGDRSGAVRDLDDDHESDDEAPRGPAADSQSHRQHQHEQTLHGRETGTPHVRSVVKSLHAHAANTSFSPAGTPSDAAEKYGEDDTQSLTGSTTTGGAGDPIQQRLQENLTLLDHIYPKTKVDLLLVEAEEFCPALVAQLSRDLGIQPSFMFIRCPGPAFPYNLGEFDGVRTIMQ